MKNTIEFLKVLFLGTIAVCSIILVIQGFGGGTQDVYVRGGSVDVDNTVSVRGSVDVDNTVDVNLYEVLGRPVGCRTSYTIDGREYKAIDVCNVCNRW